MIEVFEIDRGQRDHSTSGGSLGSHSLGFWDRQESGLST